MKHFVKSFACVGSALVGVALLTGCALTKDYVTLGYVPQTNVAKVIGAENVTVSVSVSDVRLTKDKVSAKKNGYGMEMAPIISKEDVAETLKKAMEAELSNRGFHVASGDVVLLAELSKFYNDFKIGFWSGAATAEVSMNVQVQKGDGGIAFSKIVTGEVTESGVMLCSGTNAKAALEAALTNSMAKLFGNPAFTEAMLKAAKP